MGAPAIILAIGPEGFHSWQVRAKATQKNRPLVT